MIYFFSQSGVATLEFTGKIPTMCHQVAKIPGNQTVTRKDTSNPFQKFECFLVGIPVWRNVVTKWPGGETGSQRA